MRSRLAVVSSLLVAGWIAACGGSDSTPETCPLPRRRGRRNDTTTPEASTDAAPDGAVRRPRVTPRRPPLRHAQVRCQPRMCAVRDRPGLHRRRTSSASAAAARPAARTRTAASPRPSARRRQPMPRLLRRRRGRTVQGRHANLRYRERRVRRVSDGGHVPGRRSALRADHEDVCTSARSTAQCPAAKPHCFLGDFTVRRVRDERRLRRRQGV